MSATQRVKQGFLRLPTAKKCLLIASFTLAISALLPWYDNRNTFGSGESYLGIQGPLFMVGFLVLGLGLTNFLNMFLPLLGRNFSKLKRNSGLLSIILGAESALLLLVGNTVFLHPEFGVNPNYKSTGFGMTIAFFSVGVLIIGGWWTRKCEANGKYGNSNDQLSVPEKEMSFMNAKTIPTEENVDIYSSQYTEQPLHSYTPEQKSQHDAINPTVSVQSNSETQPYTDPATKTPNSNAFDGRVLDAKARYKLMKQRQRQSAHAKNNLWGGARNYDHSAYTSRQNDRRLP